MSDDLLSGDLALLPGTMIFERTPTLRDQFAMAALQSIMLVSTPVDGDKLAELLAAEARQTYDMADAMLAARSKA